MPQLSVGPLPQQAASARRPDGQFPTQTPSRRATPPRPDRRIPASTDNAWSCGAMRAGPTNSRRPLPDRRDLRPVPASRGRHRPDGQFPTSADGVGPRPTGDPPAPAGGIGPSSRWTIPSLNPGACLTGDPQPQPEHRAGGQRPTRVPVRRATPYPGSDRARHGSGRALRHDHKRIAGAISLLPRWCPNSPRR